MAALTSAPGTSSAGTINQLPDWYTNYAKNITNLGTSLLGSLPGYNGYVDANGNPAPMVAGLSETQRQGINNAKTTAGSFTPGMAAATGTVGNGVGAVQSGLGSLGSATNAVNGASVNFGKAGAGYDQAMGMLQNGLGSINTAMGTVNSGLQGVDQAMGAVNSGMATANTGINQIGQAGGAISNMGNALGQASSYLDPSKQFAINGANGSEFSAENMARYMNPYTDGVVKDIARLGNQNLMENVLPGVNSTFTGAGQFGSTRNADFTNRAIRDNQTAISSAQAKVLADAQSQALEQAAQASNRNLQAGQQIGALSGLATNVAAGYGNQAGTQIQQGASTLNGANTQLNGAGQLLAGANSRFQGANTQLAGANGQFTAANGARDAAAGYGSLGNSQINQGQALGSLAGQQMQGGQALGALGQLQGNLAQNTHDMQLKDTQALLGSGMLEQQTNQAGLDAAYKDFLDRRDYPTQQLGALSQLLPNVSSKIQPNTQTVQVNATQPTSTYQTLADILGGLAYM